MLKQAKVYIAVIGSAFVLFFSAVFTIVQMVNNSDETFKIYASSVVSLFGTMVVSVVAAVVLAIIAVTLVIKLLRDILDEIRGYRKDLQEFRKEHDQEHHKKNGNGHHPKP